MPCCAVLSDSIASDSPLACVRVDTAPLSMTVHRLVYGDDDVELDRLRKNVAILAWAGGWMMRLDSRFCFSFLPRGHIFKKKRKREKEEYELNIYIPKTKFLFRSGLTTWVKLSIIISPLLSLPFVFCSTSTTLSPGFS